MKNRFYLLLGLIYLFLSIIIYIIADNTVFNRNICLIGNTFFALLTLVIYYISAKKLDSPTPSKFVTGFLSLSMLRFFVAIVLIFTFVLVFKKSIHKLNYIALLFFYMVYTIVETAYVLVLNKSKK